MPYTDNQEPPKHLVVCDRCGQKNRVILSSLESYRCGKCKVSLADRKSLSSAYQEDNEKQQARLFSRFLSHIRVSLASAWHPICKQFPTMRQLRVDDWMFFGVVEVIWEALRVQPDENYCLFDAGYIAILERWDKQALVAIEDCASFVARNMANKEIEDKAAERADYCGIWVLSNMYQHLPTYDESEPGRTIGRMSHYGRPNLLGYEWRNNAPPIDVPEEDIPDLINYLLYSDAA